MVPFVGAVQNHPVGVLALDSLIIGHSRASDDCVGRPLHPNPHPTPDACVRSL